MEATATGSSNSKSNRQQRRGPDIAMAAERVVDVTTGDGELGALAPTLLPVGMEPAGLLGGGVRNSSSVNWPPADAAAERLELRMSAMALAE